METSAKNSPFSAQNGGPVVASDVRVATVGVAGVGSSVTCPIYVFNDPGIIDAEGTNPVTELGRFADFVICHKSCQMSSERVVARYCRWGVWHW